jgi:tetratricopeptide (TPR) repeat protein
MKWVAWAVSLLILLFILVAVHRPVLTATAVPFNDGRYLLDNPFLPRQKTEDGSWLTRGALDQPFASRLYQAIPLLSFRLDDRLGAGLNWLQPSRAINLALHGLNSLLVVWLLFQCFRRPGLALFGGLLFGAHPIMVEPIAMLGGRSVLLAVLFSVLSLNFHVRARRQGGWLNRLACLLACLLALFSDLRSAPLPLALLLMDIWPLGVYQFKRAMALVPLLVIPLFPAMQAIARPKALPWTWIFDESAFLHLFTLSGYLMASTLQRVLWPFNLSLAYGWPHPFSPAHGVVLVHLLILLAVTAALLWWALRRRPAGLVALAGFAVWLAPALVFAGAREFRAADSYAVLPMIWLLLPLVYFLSRDRERRPGRWRLAVGAVALAVFTAEAIATQRYAAVWSTNEKLYAHLLGSRQVSDDVLVELGRMRRGQRRFGEAIDFFKGALRINPNNIDAVYRLTDLLVSQNRAPEAIPYIERALDGKDPEPGLFVALGSALVSRGEYQEALVPLDKALTISPTNVSALVNRGNALHHLNRSDESVATLRKAIELNPDQLQAHTLLAFQLAERGGAREAIAEYREVLRLQPRDIETMNNLAILLNRTGEREEAITLLRKAVELNPMNAKVLYTLGYVIELHGDPETAARHYQEVLRLDPGHRNAQVRLNRIRARSTAAEPAASPDIDTDAPALTSDFTPPSSDGEKPAPAAAEPPRKRKR